MIYPINQIQTPSFRSKNIIPKKNLKPNFVKNFKNKFNSLDYESKELLIKSTLLLAGLITGISVIAHYINEFVDKCRAIFE